MSKMEVTKEVLGNYLRLYKNMYENNGGKPDCKFMESMLEDVKALEKALKIIEREGEYEEDQNAHSEVTLEMEMGKDIPLTVWARREGISEATARQKAGRGKLASAHKVGRDWMISELEVNRDTRKK